MPLDLEFEYEAIDNLEIYLPDPIHLNVKEKKMTKIMVLPKIIGNFNTVLSIITKDKTFKYPISGIYIYIYIYKVIKNQNIKF